MESSDYVYGIIFVLYVVLFAVVGGYAITRRSRNAAVEEKIKSMEKEVKKGDSNKEEEEEKKTPSPRRSTRGKKKAE